MIIKSWLEATGSFKYLMLNKGFHLCPSGCTLIRRGLSMAFIGSVICRNGRKVNFSKAFHTNAGTVPVASTRHNWRLCKYHMNMSSPSMQLFTYCSANSDSYIELTKKDENHKELEYTDTEEVPGENENMLEYHHTGFHGDSDHFHGEFSADWEEVFKDIKEMLNCSDEKLVELIIKYPRLKDIQLLKQVRCNIGILLDKGVLKKQVVKLLSSNGILLQICPPELSDFFQSFESNGKKLEKHCGQSYKDLYDDLKLYIVTLLRGHTGEENVKVLAALLDVEYDVIVKLNSAAELNVIRHKVSIILLKEKVDFLIYEGLTPNDIGYNMELLVMSMKFLGSAVSEMKATLQEISIPTLKSLYHKRVGLRDLPPQSKVPLILDCCHEDFTKMQRAFLNNANQTNVISVALYLLDQGIDKYELKINPYVLGHKLEKVKESFEKQIRSCDTSSAEGQRKLLNLVVYDLEYGG